MPDLFTDEHRQRINAAIERAAGAVFERLHAERPRPSRGLVLGFRLGCAVVLGALCGIALAFAAPSVALVGLAVGAVAGALLGGLLARRWHLSTLRAAARTEAVRAAAQARGWDYHAAIPVGRETPLLRLGDRRKPGWGFSGTVGVRFRAGVYVYETRSTTTTTDSNGNTHTTETWTPHPHAVALVDARLDGVERFELHRGRSGGLLSRLEGAVTSMRAMELESVEFNRACKLMVADRADEVAVRQRFSPAVQVAIVERGIGELLLEGEGTTLLVALPGSVGDGDAGRILDVLADALWFREIVGGERVGHVPDGAPIAAAILGDDG